MRFSKRAEKSTLLAQTQGQEAAYASLVSSKNDEISKNRSEQATANAAAAKKYSANNLASGGSSCEFTQHWCNAAQDSLVDRWGKVRRDCSI